MSYNTASVQSAAIEAGYGAAESEQLSAIVTQPMPPYELGAMQSRLFEALAFRDAGSNTVLVITTSN